MLIVGELINASRKSIKKALEARDEDSIVSQANLQKIAGADFIDVNAGVFPEHEDELLAWLVEIVQNATGLPCCIDSPSPRAIDTALSSHKGTAMLNSISLEKERWNEMLPIVCGKSQVKVVALCMSDEGMPQTADQRFLIAKKLIHGLTREGVALNDIYVDPLVQPISVDISYGPAFLTSIEKIQTEFPGVHTICGLSNISYGLPQRKLINRSFLAMAIGRGLDSAIVNPLDRDIMATIYASDVIAGRDEFCDKYLSAFRSNKLLPSVDNG